MSRPPEVLNRYKASPLMKDAVYIGRGSPYGNPFIIGLDGDRSTVIRKYEAWVMQQPELLEKIKTELKGRDLKCFCAPNACHGDVLIKIANEGAV